jgi:hypothetical protein
VIIAGSKGRTDAAMNHADCLRGTGRKIKGVGRKQQEAQEQEKLATKNRSTS